MLAIGHRAFVHEVAEKLGGTLDGRINLRILHSAFFAHDNCDVSDQTDRIDRAVGRDGAMQLTIGG